MQKKGKKTTEINYVILTIHSQNTLRVLISCIKYRTKQPHLLCKIRSDTLFLKQFLIKYTENYTKPLFRFPHHCMANEKQT